MCLKGILFNILTNFLLDWKEICEFTFSESNSNFQKVLPQKVEGSLISKGLHCEIENFSKNNSKKLWSTNKGGFWALNSALTHDVPEIEILKSKTNRLEVSSPIVAFFDIQDFLSKHILVLVLLEIWFSITMCSSCSTHVTETSTYLFVCSISQWKLIVT